MTRAAISIPAKSRRQSRRGFALLITVTLLAFLVLLLVSLATLTRVETQVAGNSQNLAQARQNALMALNIALGQLQKYTGPDQRVTAPADIAAAADGGRLPGNSLAKNTTASNATGIINGLAPASATASVQSGTRWWTGVWGRAGASYATSAKSIYEETPSPVLLNWLVSGNENPAFTVDADGLVETSSADGRSTAATAPFTPGAPVNWAAAGLDPAAPANWTVGGYSNLEIKSSGQKAVLLVGPVTAGVNPDASGAAAVDRYVVAPMKDITIASSSVPGAGASGTTTVGRYAWWVGDEGVKASYSLADPHAGRITPGGTDTAAAESRVRLMSASRSGVELVTGFSAYPTADDTNAAVKLGRMLQMPQASLLDATLPAETQRARFHDFTIASSGVLSDTLNGGLRQDLTYYFELPQTDWDASGLAGQSIIPATWSPDWGTGGSHDYVPKWDLLYSFYNTNPDVATATLAVRPETATQVGISPIITQFRMAVFTDMSLVTAAGSNVKNIKDGTYSWPIRCNVVFVLANPYNVTLTAPAGSMEFVIKNNSTAGSSNRLHIRAYAINDQNNIGGKFDILRDARASDPNGLLDTVKFIAPALSIPPGETATLSVAGQQQLSGTNLAAAEPVNAVQLAVNTVSNFVRPIPTNPTAADCFFTSAAPFTFTTSTISTGVAPPGRSIVAAYSEGVPNLMITLRDASSPTRIYQQIRDVTPGKSGDMQGFENNIMCNLMMKFLAPGYRNLTGNPPIDRPGHPDQGDPFLYDEIAQGRVYQDYNIRAVIVDKANAASAAGGGNAGCVFAPAPYAAGLFAPPNTPASTVNAQFTVNLTPASWAEDFGPGDGINGRNSVASQGVLFDFPRRATGQPPVLSIGQLQHASLTANDYNPAMSDPADLSRTAKGSIGDQPAYAVGNSYAAPLVARVEAVGNRINTYVKGPGGNTRYFDMAYLLNTSLWDGYYFSGIPQSSSTFAPLNPRYEIYDNAVASDVRSKDAAAHLMTKGAFNINSTSHDAWVALLGGLDGLRVNNDVASDSVPFPRTLWQPVNNTKTGATYKSSGTGTDNDAYAGYRRLTGAEIDTLATELVKRVRARGPFVSLSHFINRSLVAASSAFNATINDADISGNLADSAVPMGRGLSGPMQAAIDSAAAGLNTFITTSSGDVVTGNGANAYGDRVLFNGELIPGGYIPKGDNSITAYFADMKVDWANTNWHFDESAPPGPYGRTSTGLPGWLLQGDLLQALGPALSARSDTFIIRTYGEVVNPADATQILARTWCEAVVQRLPEYCEPAVNAAASQPSALVGANQTFGRRYTIVGFRWLSANDI
ncbi:MAG: hypothetical protein WC661_11540 [Opitutaceae bacterium]|jgi:Tfp pilus assembly protein PilX